MIDRAMCREMAKHQRKQILDQLRRWDVTNEEREIVVCVLKVRILKGVNGRSGALLSPTIKKRANELPDRLMSWADKLFNSVLLNVRQIAADMAPDSSSESEYLNQLKLALAAELSHSSALLWLGIAGVATLSITIVGGAIYIHHKHHKVQKSP